MTSKGDARAARADTSRAEHQASIDALQVLEEAVASPGRGRELSWLGTLNLAEDLMEDLDDIARGLYPSDEAPFQPQIVPCTGALHRV